MSSESAKRSFRWPWRPNDQIVRDVDDEMAFHLDMRTRKLIELGMDEAAARAAAHAEYGDLDGSREALIQTGGRTEQRRRLELFADEVRQDLRFALRSMASGRSTLLTAGLVLSLAIAAAMTTYSIFAGVLLRSLPYHHPGSLVDITSGPLLDADGELRDGDWFAVNSEEAAGVIEDSRGIFSSTSRTRVTHPEISVADKALRAPVALVDPAFFPLMGSRARLGRTLTSSDAEQASGVAVVSYGFWTKQMGRTPDVLGQLVRIGEDEMVEVVGVMPRGFNYPLGAQIWRPEPGAGVQFSEIPSGVYWMVGRLAPGADVSTAGELLQQRVHSAGLDDPALTGTGASVEPLLELLVEEVERPLRLLLFAVLLVLLTACANLGAVLLARGVGRQQELAVRFSLGATRWRIVRQLLTEAILLTSLSSALGLALAAFALPILVRTQLQDLPRASEIGLDGGVLGMAAIAAVVTGILAGSIPALVLSTRTAYLSMKSGGPNAGVSRLRRRVMESAVLVQVCLSVVVMTGAAALVWNIYQLATTPLGYDGPEVTVAQFGFTQERYASRDSRQLFVETLLERTVEKPWVESATISDGAPFLGGGLGTSTLETADGDIEVAVWQTLATPGFFRTMGIRLARGSLYVQDGDRTDVVVNEAFVRETLGDGDPLGKRVRLGRFSGTIVGVVSDTRHWELREPPPPQLFGEYFSPAQLRPTYVHLIVRHAPDYRGARGELEQIIRDVDPYFPVERIESMADVAMDTVATERLYGYILGGFALLAFTILLIGVAAVAGESVLQRGREIGIRLAAGATSAHMLRMVLGRMGIVVLGGVALGVIVTIPIIPFLENALPELDAIGLELYLAATLLIASGSMLAAFAPARRAANTDPMAALRTD